MSRKKIEHIKRSSFYQDMKTLTPTQLKQEKRLDFIVKNIYGFVFLLVLIAFILPVYLDDIRQNDQEKLKTLGYEEMLIELRLISLLSESTEDYNEKKVILDEIKQVSSAMDKEYRTISKLHKEEKEYYSYFVGTINSYIELINEYYTNKNESNEDILTSADNLLFNFYLYKTENFSKLNLPTLEDKEELKKKISKDFNQMEFLDD